MADSRRLILISSICVIILASCVVDALGAPMEWMEADPMELSRRSLEEPSEQIAPQEDFGLETESWGSTKYYQQRGLGPGSFWFDFPLTGWLVKLWIKHEEEEAVDNVKGFGKGLFHH
ncbi:hypothetical protein LSTR_LSTR015449 [Laodelphax striatellus]|uniref:Uncharacterized protein n=1 Tax=Laodelphax striatellus TaxID=195883 RepID=A0A482WEA5_LAOST|nr:hypothetical protein LSTR_LSTR015449 [Laodelphax striatellus]